MRVQFRALAGAFAGGVLGICLAWLVILLGAPDTTIDTALEVMLIAGALGGVGGVLLVWRRRGRTIG